VAYAIRVDPSSPTTPGCQRACTQIGWVGSGPDPNTCQDICPDTAAPAPPTTSTVPPGCQERCTASMPPQCQTVCPQPATVQIPGGLGGAPGSQLPNPNWGNPQGRPVDTGTWPTAIAGQGGNLLEGGQGTVGNPHFRPQRRWGPMPTNAF
jgi:hypothetical protein